MPCRILLSFRFDELLIIWSRWFGCIVDFICFFHFFFPSTKYLLRNPFVQPLKLSPIKRRSSFRDFQSVWLTIFDLLILSKSQLTISMAFWSATRSEVYFSARSVFFWLRSTHPSRFLGVKMPEFPQMFSIVALETLNQAPFYKLLAPY